MLTKWVKRMRPVEQFLYWISERENIREQKEAGQPKPWTDDEILQKYKFCNVHREDDRVTRWIAKNWRDPNEDDRDVWFAMVVARFINWPKTLATIGYPVPYTASRHKATFKALSSPPKGSGKVWGAAYTISTNGLPMTKPAFVTERIFKPVWQNRNYLRPSPSDLLATFATRLKEQFGFSGFMTGQIVADVKYTYTLEDAEDWWTWALSGPGSRRGMNRILGIPVNHRLKESKWFAELSRLSDLVTKTIEGRIHYQDLQNCLCEYDKYARTLNGEGRPRSKYPGT